MHRRAVRTLIAALSAAFLLAPATAGAYTIEPGAAAPEGDALVFTIDATPGEAAAVAAANFDPQPGGDPAAAETTDFDGTPRKAQFTGGEWRVSVPTVEDDLDEADEKVRLVSGTVSGEGTITDDDPPPPLSIADVSTPENEAADAKATITTANASSRDITIPLATNGGADLSVPASVVLKAGETSVAVPLTVADDFEDELDEPFAVTLGAADGATIADGEGVVTIVNDDLRVVDVSDASTPEGDGINGIAQFVVRLNAPTFRPVTVRYVTVDGSAKAPSDYLVRSGQFTIPPGQTQVSLDVAVVADDRKEEAEAFALGLTEVENGRFGDPLAIGVILDDDAEVVGSGDASPPKITLSSPKADGRRVTLRVSCPRGERRCAGRIALYTVPDRRAKARSLRREQRAGAKAFSVRGGASKTVAVTLPASLVRAARRAGRLKLQAFAVTEDAEGNVDTRTRSATLRYGKRRSR